ncbi:MAG: hypothetical protein H6Q76_1358 [Firmicutes bacterium]|nr:hypothetical protein [Bacillota bacterium]
MACRFESGLRHQRNKGFGMNSRSLFIYTQQKTPRYAWEFKKGEAVEVMTKKLSFAYNRSVTVFEKHAKESDSSGSQPRTYQMELPISYRMGTKVQTKNHLWKISKRNWGDHPKTVQLQGHRDRRGKRVYRPHTHVPKDTAQIQRSTNNGVSQGKEFTDDFRAIPKFEIQIRQSAFLV